MIRALCHCASVQLQIDAPPSEVTECNCSICRRYGVLWAYHTPEQVTASSPELPTEVYVWNGRTTEFHHCRICGCVSHWAPTDRERDRMGVNAHLMEPEILARARVRHLDGADTDEYID